MRRGFVFLLVLVIAASVFLHLEYTRLVSLPAPPPRPLKPMANAPATGSASETAPCGSASLVISRDSEEYVPPDISELPFALASPPSSIQDELKAWPLDRNPDFWLIKTWAARADWERIGKILRKSLVRPQPNHFHFLFSNASARVEFRSWLFLSSRRKAEEVFKRLDTFEMAIPGSWTSRVLIAGHGWSATDDPTLVSRSKEMVGTLSAELLSALQVPDEMPLMVGRWDHAESRRCRLLLARANARLPQPDPILQVAAVDFLYQHLRSPIPGTGRQSQPDEGNWAQHVDRSWSLPQLPVCSGERYTFVRGRWTCPLHGSAPMAERAADPATAPEPLGEAWQEFLFCHPELRPQSYRAGGL